MEYGLQNTLAGRQHLAEARCISMQSQRNDMPQDHLTTGESVKENDEKNVEYLSMGHYHPKLSQKLMVIHIPKLAPLIMAINAALRGGSARPPGHGFHRALFVAQDPPQHPSSTTAQRTGTK